MKCASSLPYSVKLCSGNGYVCSAPDVGCICNSGWTSWGDFSLNNYGSECLINHRSVRIMAYFCVLVSSICNVLIIGYYISVAKRKKSCYIISREYKTLFPFCFLITGISSVCFGILKIYHYDDQQPLIGRDLSASFLVFVFTTSAFFGLVIYLNLILEFIQLYPRMMTSTSMERCIKRFQLLSYFSWFILPAVSIVGIMPLIATAFPSKSRQLCMTYLIGISMVVFTYGLIFANCLSFLLKELNDYIKDSEGPLSKDMKVVANRLNAVYIVSGGSTLVFGTLYVAFASSNFLFHLTTYFQLFNYICVPPTTIVLVMTVAGVSNSSKQIVPATFDDTAHAQNDIDKESNTSRMGKSIQFDIESVLQHR